ncbi:hypothetical protein ANN_25780 [Periplaneta americana]|uniref:Uncharacterized protein n=1 Tax=Periplaneta americana TaxID=6978 RepID=A0ABQ8S450_PERAM|nr:hypothetical protein ANN_25780 [Periplaneta americana]
MLKEKLESSEMKFLRSVAGYALLDYQRNEDIRYQLNTYNLCKSSLSGGLCMGMTRDNMAPQCDSSPFPVDKCQKRKRRWDVTPEDLEKEKEILKKEKWKEESRAEKTLNNLDVDTAS